MNDPTTSTMPPPLRELTLIVAATSKMGIGLNGTLPWTGLKKEMAYFARVTKRVQKPGNQNAVLMGRKTWDSIPPKFRPLKDRTNIVISRSFSQNEFQTQEGSAAGKEYYQTGSLEGAVQGLSTLLPPNENSETIESSKAIEKVFVIGGGQIYKAALEMKEAKRILLTRVLDEFECDTHFLVRLGEDGRGEGGWIRRGKGELDRWVGEVVSEGVQVEGETRYVFEMWEREDI